MNENVRHIQNGEEDKVPTKELEDILESAMIGESVVNALVDKLDDLVLPMAAVLGIALILSWVTGDATIQVTSILFAVAAIGFSVASLIVIYYRNRIRRNAMYVSELLKSRRLSKFGRKKDGKA